MIGFIGTFLALLGPLLVTEGVLLGWRSRGNTLPHATPAQVNLGCAMITLLILFAWPVAIIIVLTFMVTTGKKG